MFQSIWEVRVPRMAPKLKVFTYEVTLIFPIFNSFMVKNGYYYSATFPPYYRRKIEEIISWKKCCMKGYPIKKHFHPIALWKSVRRIQNFSLLLKSKPFFFCFLLHSFSIRALSLLPTFQSCICIEWEFRKGGVRRRRRQCSCDGGKKIGGPGQQIFTI